MIRFLFPGSVLVYLALLVLAYGFFGLSGVVILALAMVAIGA